MSDAKSYMKMYVRQGLEKLAYSKEDAESIAEYFYQSMDEDLVKQAGLFDNPNFLKGLGEGTAKIGLGVAAGAGLMGAHGLYEGLIQRPIQNRRFDAALEQAIQRNQVLQHAERSKVNDMANTIRKYAPNAAADPNLLSSILSNAVMMDGIDPTVLQSLLNLERTYKDTNKLSIKDVVLL